MTQDTLAKRISASKIERFLTELANLRGQDESAQRFHKRYADWFADLPSAERWFHPRGEPFHGTSAAELEKLRAINLSNHMQGIWRAPTREARQFKALKLHQLMWWSEKGDLLLAPQIASPSPLAQALLYLL